ncbi:tumor necrosis factor ligand superfamily member 15-like [Lethenteron reissneri]|uniref:tumor necrosis factor ligand superfamily member 15-like n=1 Tax=Lethenteron reissneri TaxID=7753 RepID=UPI002AB5E8B8|nr:tumor necrosis factor ligand superfamily member 15-like [Lethenteron reissneri]
MSSRDSFLSERGFTVHVPAGDLGCPEEGRGKGTSGSSSNGLCRGLITILAALLVMGATGAIVFALYQARRDLANLKQSLPSVIHSAMITELEGFQVGPYERQMTENNSQSGKPLAHLTVRASPAASLPAKGAGNVSWESLALAGVSFLRNGLILHNGNVRIDKEGDYFIYSQVYFQSSDCSEGAGGDHVLVHAVNRKAPSYEMPFTLMEAVKSRCGDGGGSGGLGHRPATRRPPHHPHRQSPGRPWFGSSYQGGVFKLEAGDQLYVSVSDLSLVSDAADKTYFGLFML